MAELVVLLRAVNVGGRKMPMAELRDLCGELGYEEPQTYIQSGNLLIRTDAAADDVAAQLGRAIASRFGFESPVIVRAAERWQGYLDDNPFAGDSSVEDRMLHLVLAQKAPPPSAVETLEALAQAGERVRIAGDALWIDYGQSVARSKLTPKAIDKAVGAPATARNLRSVRKLAGMIEERMG